MHVVHGSGGGFDQGELIARALFGDSFHWIAPSRFGYLHSTFVPGATFVDQAHGYRHLLDPLGIERVAVAALSHDGPSALLLAALYPDRVSSLVLISCGVAFDNKAALPNEKIAGIRAPTLIFHAADDTLQRYRNAEFATTPPPTPHDGGRSPVGGRESGVYPRCNRRAMLRRTARRRPRRPP